MVYPEHEAEAGRSQSSSPAWSMKQVLGQDIQEREVGRREEERLRENQTSEMEKQDHRLEEKG
ncbi:hypothetical protein I79_021875 [Cricetulus griseus]|uniref:Uncharacterized protein n=1 Tax=Cricetulus griseus TaxID=10029 RepID=G3IDT9_CRIGR|nr:hypothetical protein I79_021875 [Cricetulus griseus]